MQERNDDRLLSRQEVDQRFGISRRFLEVAVQRGTGPRFVRVGRLVRYRPADVRSWIESCTSDPSNKPAGT